MTQGITAKAQILIHRPANEVFDAFVEPETMAKFWFTRRDDGLREGETVTWFIGPEPDAPRIEVQVTSLKRPDSIVMKWGHAASLTTVSWTFEEKAPTTTLLRVEESGLSGTTQEIIDAALDSTGGFNQVVVAAKAWLEHKTVVNVVADRA